MAAYGLANEPQPRWTSGGRLEILPSGTTPPDAGEFVTTSALASVLDRLRERSDVVLVDAPPMLHVGDAMALAARVEAMIVVTRLTVVRQPMIAELRRVLDRCPAAKLGFVVTDADLEPGYGYGGYGGYYAYRPKEPAERERVR